MQSSALRTILVTCAVAFLLAAPVHAQRDAKVTFSGTVVDVESEAPIAQAVVVLSNIRAMAVTDSEGRFTFNAIPPGTHRFVVRRLGYTELVEDVEITGGESTTISLLARPMVLEGITVQADRLATRRRSSVMSVRALDRNQMVATGGFNAAEMASNRLGIARRTCGDGSFNCALVRGRVQRIQVYIDDRPAFGGMEELEIYAPHELYALESYEGGRMVRAYTLWFMEDLARGKRTLDPVLTR